MRWDAQKVTQADDDALEGLARPSSLVRTVTTPEFAGVTFHEVMAKSALNHVPGQSEMPFSWTINPYRGCSHACTYCFARPTHSYLDLGAGDDFDRQVVVKVNVADVLRSEVMKPSWGRHNVALGTNTDPYQRAEGRYRLMPDIARTLADSGTPFSILTKGTMIRRDLPLLARLARDVRVDVSMSIAIYDDALQRSVEKGTPTTAARLQTVRAVREAGLDCTVFLMPILPHLTDSREHLSNALTRIRDAGATSVVSGPLHLKRGVKPWFMMWLQREHPELLGAYERLYADSAYAPADYREWLADRMDTLLVEHGLADGGDGRVVTATPKSYRRPDRSDPRGSASGRGAETRTGGRVAMRPVPGPDTEPAPLF